MMASGSGRSLLQKISTRGSKLIVPSTTAPKHCHRFSWMATLSSSESFIAPDYLRRKTATKNKHQKRHHTTRSTGSDASSRLSIHPRAATKVQRNSTIQELRQKTRDWLQLPLNSWTQKEVSRGRFLVREWSNTSNNDTEKAVQQTRILKRWVRERTSATAGTNEKSSYSRETTIHNKADSEEMVEMLNRCLDSWRKASSTLGTASTSQNNGSRIHNPPLESVDLVSLFVEASESLEDMYLKPTEKSYSMCMNVLALYPDLPNACENVMALLGDCRRMAEPDLQFYNVCLHTLAKCAKHHLDAPLLVEKIVSEMEPPLSPNTACFVSLLHAWANTISLAAPPGSETRTACPAERAQAILDRMIQQYPELVDSVCFNICIDAWAKQGNPEKAESILWRLNNYHHSMSPPVNEKDNSKHNNNGVRPNDVSFNSAINAWAKSAVAKTQNSQAAADRAEHLLKQMKQHGYEPTAETYGAIMEAHGKIPNSGAKVQSLLDELELLFSEGRISFPPSKVCYLMAIKAWGKTKSEGAEEQAERIVQRMEDSSLAYSQLESPCVIIYTALLSVWSQSGAKIAPDRAWSIFKAMQKRARSTGRKDLVPNTISLNAVLQAFCSHDRTEEARRVVLAQTKGRIRPDARSYHIMLKGYTKSKDPDAAEKAEDLLRDLENEYHSGKTRTRPTIRMYMQLLVAWGNSRRSDAAVRAEEIFWKMARNDAVNGDDFSVAPDTAILNCVLRAWSKSFEGGSAEKAEAFLRKAQTDNEIKVNPVSHLHLIYAWGHSRRGISPQKAEEHLQKARELCSQNPDWRLTGAHYRGVIMAWEKCKDRDASKHIQKLQEEMALLE